jgi:hypothetical protein
VRVKTEIEVVPLVAASGDPLDQRTALIRDATRTRLQDVTLVARDRTAGGGRPNSFWRATSWSWRRRSSDSGGAEAHAGGGRAGTPVLDRMCCRVWEEVNLSAEAVMLVKEMDDDADEGGLRLCNAR